ncbi:MAG: hypothetical protein CV087_23440 [Candidatus Brocadia sp. WS118]|nr:MAG: hypothetical protein CV087_23440 [Candidatus Brocadia sp. WS118]
MENERTDRKYQVFISSTFKDLSDHRQAAMRAIIKAGHLPIALENFTPDSKDKVTVIQTAIKSAQFFVLILGYRYGYRPQKKNGTLGPSYTEMELNWAEQAGLKIVALLLDEDIAKKNRSELAGPEARDELNSEEEYWALRKRFTEKLEQPLYKPFSKIEDIYAELLAYFSRPHDVPGYILEPEDTNAGNVLKVYANNKVLQAVVKRFGQFEMVEKRLSVGSEQKESLAEAFDELHGDDIEQQKYDKLFFESGSTLIYVAKQLAHRLPRRLYPRKKRLTPTVLTNNALAYVYLWLCESIMCHPEPEGPPVDKYGGMYGPLTDYQKAPNYDLQGLSKDDPQAAELIKGLSHLIFGPPEKNSQTLILAAMSGLQLSDQMDVVYAADKNPLDTEEDLFKKIQNCRGFHVGSYRNKLFKRCLYLSKAPTIFFIHDEKVDCQIEVGKCHFIFDQEMPWNKFIIEHPVSLWIGCTRKSYREVLQKCQSFLKTGDWKFTIYGEPNPFPIIIGHNQSFRKMSANVDVVPLGG